MGSIKTISKQVDSINKMRFSYVIALFCLSLCIQGCVGTTFLKRGQPDNKGYRETPWLCDVPDRPKPTSFADRGKLKDKLEDDYEKEFPQINDQPED